MNALDERLSQAFDDEPPVGDAVEAVLERAEQLRKGRIRRVLLTGVAAVLVVAAAGYGLTSVLLPGTPPVRPAAVAPQAPSAPAADPMETVLSRISGLTVTPRLPVTTSGWRHYSAVDAQGLPRGVIEVSAYRVTGSFCLPVQNAPKECSLLERTPDGVEFVRYRWDRDIEWQVNQAVSRRADGRVLVVVATGPRNTHEAQAGRPPLSGLETERAATDPQIMAAFEETESCNDPASACPALRIAVPVG